MATKANLIRPKKLKIYTQWTISALLKVAAVPKGGPAVTQFLTPAIILEQPEKPGADQIQTALVEFLNGMPFSLLSAEIYQGSRVAFVATEEAPDSGPDKE